MNRVGIDVPTELQLDDESNIVNKYNLSSAIIHMGDLNSGHYICYTRRSSGWICCNDSVIDDVSALEMQNVLCNSETVFMLVYSKILYEVNSTIETDISYDQNRNNLTLSYGSVKFLSNKSSIDNISKNKMTNVMSLNSKEIDDKLDLVDFNSVW